MVMLELKHICQSYKKGKPVLRDISFTIPAGQFVSVIGPSGAGKTTLLRLFNHMVCPDSGEVWIDEVRFDTLKSRKRRTIQQRVGMIFQDFCLVDTCTCLQNVLNGCLARIPLWRALSGFFPRVEKEKALAALEAVGMEEYSQTLAHALSGGQKQRVAIARTLMCLNASETDEKHVLSYQSENYRYKNQLQSYPNIHGRKSNDLHKGQ